MAVHPLRPATDRRFGGPLPRQLANQTRTHPVPMNLFTQCHAAPCAYAVLPAVSSCYSPVRGRLSTRYSPVRHYGDIHPKISITTVRLACVRHAASVHPEPGSNSHVKKNISTSSSCKTFAFRSGLKFKFNTGQMTWHSFPKKSASFIFP